MPGHLQKLWNSYCHAPDNINNSGIGHCCANWLNSAEAYWLSSWTSQFVGLCSLHALCTIFYFLFFLSWLGIFARRKIPLLKNARQEIYSNGVHKTSSSIIKPGIHINVAIAGCVFLLSVYTGQAAWEIISALGFRFPVHLAVLVVVRLAAWLAATTSAIHTRIVKKEKFPEVLRCWWCTTFVLSVISLTFHALFSAADVSEPFLEEWIDLVSVPITFSLCIVGVVGRTGTRMVEDESLTEPLLSEKQENEQKDPGVTPYATASIYSLATLSWINPLLKLGARTTLELKDVPFTAPRERSENSFNTFQRNWDKAKLSDPSRPPSLVVAIARSFWRIALLNTGVAMLSGCASYVGPYLIDDFVEYLAGRRRFAYEGYLLVFLFFAAKLAETLGQRQWYLGLQLMALHFRSALTGFVYQKGLRLSNHARQSHTSGEITNYVSVDVQRVGDFAWFFPDLTVVPVQVLISLAILYKVVGLAALAALAAAIVTVAANVPLAKLQDKFQDKLMAAKDKRMKALTECLRSMRVLKLQAWENKYLEKIEGLRYGEYIWLRKGQYASAASTFVFWSAPMFVSVLTFTTCVFLQMELTAGRILTALAIFRVLQDPLSQIPELISMIAQTRVSLDRLQKYLQEEELQEDAVIRTPWALSGNEFAIAIKEAEFKWDPAAELPSLKRLNLHVKKGQSVAICGTVGSGKSTLLSCILGEIPKLCGTVTVSGSTAYVPQTAWIQSSKIEENILFGKPMDRAKYEDALRACALQKDLQQFTFGDQTVIGERGINMSGGQKQRIQLARAVYQDCDIYLLDDPFSAVDAHTGSDLFKNCIFGALASKTVLYVTHQVEFLPAADLILVFRDGELVQSGKYEELLRAGADFQKFVGAHNEAIDFMDASGFKRCETSSDEKVADSEGEKESSNEQVAKQNDEEITPDQSKRQIVQDEERERGNISFSVYWSYLTAVHKGALVPLIILSQITFQIFQIAGNFWMAWSAPDTAGEPAKTNSATLILVYVALAFGSSVFVSLRAVLVATVGLLTAQKFFMNMLRAVFRAPMSFFDSTPTGRILSRASSDQNALDNEILFSFSGMLLASIQLVGIVYVMCQVTWLILILVLPVTVVCVWMQRFYIKSARELQRLNGIGKSPIIHHYAESIAGAAVIRGFGEQTSFLHKNFVFYDAYSRSLFHNFAAIQWLMLRMEFLSTLVFSFSLIYVVVFPFGAMNPSLAGLAVTYGLQLNGILAWWVWGLCTMENRVVSIERILQYSRVASEAPLVIDDSRPSKEWPALGTIELQDLQVRYNEHTPLVLHGITCTFPGGQKVGVVGRTGSGKSTLIQALFRLVEPAGGKIIVDGVDISGIGLHDLRLKLSIIPQDPTLFEGTLRANLDPLEEHSDYEVWEALDKCQLGDIVRLKEEKLECGVTENGENWSVGQRQLVCLGRALLKRTQILVLDEATASVDSVTDGIIQRTIRSEFGSRTVITVAHRIPTVIDSDLVLVLSDGLVAEYDSPVKLLEERSSLFYKLVAEYSTRSGSSPDLVTLL